MSHETKPIQGVVLDEALLVDLDELVRLCGVGYDLLLAMVGEGLLHPIGRSPADWRFSGVQIQRARRALRLRRDLELDWAGTAVALDLIEQVEQMRIRIRCLELQLGQTGIQEDGAL